MRFKRCVGVRLKNKSGDFLTVNNHAKRISRLARRVHAWSDAVSVVPAGRKSGYRDLLITLTYRPSESWAPGHIRQFIKDLRRGLGKRLIGYAWVAELHASGVVHYHVQIIIKGYLSRKLLKKWRHGHWFIKASRHRYYIVGHQKRAGQSKEYQRADKFPSGLRLFAVWFMSGLVPEMALLEFKASSLPIWLRDLVILDPAAWSEGWARAPGGGWVNRSTGEVLQSGWEFDRLVYEITECFAKPYCRFASDPFALTPFWM